MRQIMIEQGDYGRLDSYFQEHECKCVLLVCDESLKYLNIKEYFDNLAERLEIQIVKFSEFQPNPQYESVVRGVELFLEKGCDMIFAVGGGSAMDVAKCIKLYSNMNREKNYLEQPIVRNNVPLAAMPTTAGTGSEATRYAVLYYEGEKQSIADESCIPELVVFDRSALKTLPMYQKKATVMDALCHAVESFWSVNSTEQSKEFSAQAIRLILENMDGYLENEDQACVEMLRAANLAGHAINITQTTAGHAMCYKLTSLYGIAHGHAAALCDRYLWPYMLEHTEDCVDGRGEAYLTETFRELAEVFGKETAGEGLTVYVELLDKLELKVPKAAEDDFVILRSSVNPVRLKNNPVRLDEAAIDGLYHEILYKGE